MDVPVPPASEPPRSVGAKAAPGRSRSTERDREMAVATVARRAFVAALVSRTDDHDAMVEFALADLVRHPSDDMPVLSDVVAQLTPTGPVPNRSLWSTERHTALDDRLANVLFAMVAGTIESSWSDHVWHCRNERRAGYLRFLGSQGYALSELERAMVRPRAQRGGPRKREGR